MKEVTESEFLEAYKNLDNTRIMNKVCSRYRNTIPHDEIERCKLVALWEAMEAIETLVPKYKNILHQRFFERMTMQEIADRNNYSRETARRYINIALEKLRECLPK